jgi:LAO/AO transport system kinase
MLNMKMTEETWRPPVIRTSTLKEEGVDNLLAAVNVHADYLRECERYSILKKKRASSDTLEILALRWQEHIHHQMKNGGPVNDWFTKVLNYEMDPYTAAAKILDFLLRPTCNVD